MTPRLLARTFSRLRYFLLGRGRYEESNRGDDHGVPGREDYTVILAPVTGQPAPAPIPSPYPSSRWTRRQTRSNSARQCAWQARFDGVGQSTSAAFSPRQYRSESESSTAYTPRLINSSRAANPAWTQRINHAQ